MFFFFFFFDSFLKIAVAVNVLLSKSETLRKLNCYVTHYLKISFIKTNIIVPCYITALVTHKFNLTNCTAETRISKLIEKINFTGLQRHAKTCAHIHSGRLNENVTKIEIKDWPIHRNLLFWRYIKIFLIFFLFKARITCMYTKWI